MRSSVHQVLARQFFHHIPEDQRSQAVDDLAAEICNESASLDDESLETAQFLVDVLKVRPSVRLRAASPERSWLSGASVHEMLLPYT